MATAWAVAMATVNQADECPDVQMMIRRRKQYAMAVNGRLHPP